MKPIEGVTNEVDVLFNRVAGCARKPLRFALISSYISHINMKFK